MPPKIIVIVEDTESVASCLALALENIPGIKAVVTPDPRTALRMFHTPEARIAALVTDLNLPHLNGFELIREVRTLDGYSKLPVIMVTAEDQTGHMNRRDLYSPDAIFHKPFSVREVCRVLEELLQ
jgi:DNA-binding response OmpR family regulator